jgi:hypothetical protein
VISGELEITSGKDSCGAPLRLGFISGELSVERGIFVSVGVGLCSRPPGRPTALRLFRFLSPDIPCSCARAPLCLWTPAISLR